VNITYTNDLVTLRAGQLQGFFVDWPRHPDPLRHLEILQNSYAVWLALDEGRCVGFINALSDGIFYAYIPLLEVLPEYQNQGIGAELVRRMLGTLAGMYAVDLVCDEPVIPFYDALGFRRSVGMIRRDHAHQDAKG
jgi:ribosomal protein S18 acetylase RimI-like enzyme